ncbi:MAG: bifunctional diguanylate cyclase/phosphodiesterase [Actinomycetota bacterium]
MSAASTEDQDAFETARRQVGRLSTSALAPAIVLLLVVLGDAEPFYDPGPWTVLALALGFVICEPLVFHIEARNEAVSFSPTDLPLAIGMLVVSPVALVAARIVGSAVLLVAWRRQPLFKFTLNLTAFTAETVIAALLFRAVYQPGDDAEPLMWLWLIVSLLAGLVFTGVLIALAISRFEGDAKRRVVRELRHSYLFYLPGAVLGSAAAIPLLIEPWLALLFILPMPAVWLVLRSHGSLMHRFSDLSNVFDFSSLVGRSAELQAVADIAVAEIAEQPRAGTVALVVWEREAAETRAVAGRHDALAALPASFDDLGAPLHSPRGIAPADRFADAVDDLDMGDTLLAPLMADQETIGVLLVGDRQGAATRFDEHDQARLQQIAEQLGIVIRKAQLHVHIQHEATHDRLTGLPNRSYFEAFTVEQLADDDATTAVFLIDLDRFKEVNDTLGHQAGDLLLRSAAQRIRSCLTDHDLAARFGGDEFAAVIPGIGEHEALVAAEMISAELERPFQLGESTVAIAASIGIAIGPHHGDQPADLLRRADLAMYDAKRHHNRSAVYDPAMDGSDSVRLALLGELRDAIRHDTLDVAFQPQVDLRTGEVVGVEALARWDRPGRGSVSPEVFVAVAEQAGLIEELTELVLRRSLTAIARWHAEGMGMHVSVNLSALSLMNEDLPNVVSTVLEDAGVPARFLTLEITEQSTIGDSPRSMRILEQLAEVGVRISIDDFGTGHSSLVNLRRLPFAELKVDRSFVSEMIVERNDEVIVRSTIDLGHNLGYVVVAEGVETEEIRSRLAQMGCDLAQGFGICRPLAAEQLSRWLATQPVVDADGLVTADIRVVADRPDTLR